MAREMFYYKRFKGQPRVLVIRAPYFGYREAVDTMKELGWDVLELALKDLERGRKDFLEQLLLAIAFFKPDFLFTINHFGFDREGKLASIFKEHEIVCVSWFIDNPFFIMENINQQIFDTLVIACWDSFYVERLKRVGFKEVLFMPHGYNPNIFSPSDKSRVKYKFSFVGNSMYDAYNKINNRLSGKDFQDLASHKAKELAFKKLSGITLKDPDYFDLITKDLSLLEQQNGKKFPHEILDLIIWKATLFYRHSMLSAFRKDELTVFGDKGWKKLNGHCTLKPPVNYYKELGKVYQSSQINLNITSLQMPCGLNQRVFDVPGAGGFLLTDYQEDLEVLFDTKKEVASFKSKDEMISMASFYLKNETLRKQITSRALERIMKEHTLMHRFIKLYKKVKGVFA